MKKELPKTWWGNLKYPCLHGVLHFAVAMRHLPGQSFLCTQGCCTWFSSKSAKRIWSNNCRRFWFTFSTSESGAWRSRPWSRPHLWQEEICCIFCDEKSPFQVSLSPLRCIQNVWVRARACRFSALRPWLHLGRGMSLLKQCRCNRLLFCFGKKLFWAGQWVLQRALHHGPQGFPLLVYFVLHDSLHIAHMLQDQHTRKGL